MPFSGLLRRVALVRTDVSEERSIHSLSRLLVTANVVPSSPIHVTLVMEATRSSETSVLTRATRRNMPKDDIIISKESFNILICNNNFQLSNVLHTFYLLLLMALRLFVGLNIFSSFLILYTVDMTPWT
jgi:hypothetical protein